MQNSTTSERADARHEYHPLGEQVLVVLHTHQICGASSQDCMGNFSRYDRFNEYGGVKKERKLVATHFKLQ